ncbi:MAG: peptide-methionine (S)-S-oxide reductase [Alphaproteobacteria bacterium]|nr:MAG: peptide-methionine (S)-S-oxide reductase [Alphaproteobacteria bacterium]
MKIFANSLSRNNADPGLRRGGEIFFALLIVFGISHTALAADTAYKTAVFAGGCFWSMESAFDDVKGVVKTEAGFAGGTLKNPSYEQVSHGDTGHREAVQVTYDPAVISYDGLLDVYWHSIDPTDARGQFCDKGEEYKSAVFYGSDDEKKLAEDSKQKVAKELDKGVATDILAAAPFYPAEDYHQAYHKKNPEAYGMYRRGCGRDNSLRFIWGDKAKTMPGF